MSTEAGDEVIRYYAARAVDYDRTAGYTDAEAERLREPMKERFRLLFDGRDVLEIACGTGYWTEVIASTAKSILATDANPSVISIAQDRCTHLSNVEFEVSDAHLLENVHGVFNAAFAHWWWSHIPKSRTREFVSSLHDKLNPGALVVIADQLLYDWPGRRPDCDGNLLETRSLSNGRTFEIIKNFPTADELGRIFSDVADEFHYIERPSEGNWELTYFLRPNPGS